jgi:hypothetical protein
MKRSIERFQQYKALHRILSDYPQAFSEKPEVQSTLDQFDNLNGQLSTLISNLLRPVSGVYRPRKELRDAYFKSLTNLIDLGVLIARKTGNQSMQAMMMGYRSTSFRASHYRLYEIGVDTVRELSAFPDLVSSLGKEATLLESFSTLAEEFSGKLGDTGIALNIRRSQRREFTRLLTDCHGILRYELDRYVAHHKLTYPEMFNLYESMRRPHRRKKRSGEKPGISLITGSVTDAVTGQAIAGAGISLIQQASVIETDADGFFEIEDLHEGKYTLGCFASGYQVPENQEVTLGADDIVEVNFTLQPVNPILN